MEKWTKIRRDVTSFKTTSLFRKNFTRQTVALFSTNIPAISREKKKTAVDLSSQRNYSK